MAVKKWTRDLIMAMAEIRGDGKTYREIGLAFGVSSERARQLVSKAERTHLREWQFANGWTVVYPGGRWVDPPNCVELWATYQPPKWSSLYRA